MGIRRPEKEETADRDGFKGLPTIVCGDIVRIKYKPLQNGKQNIEFAVCVALTLTRVCALNPFFGADAVPGFTFMQIRCIPHNPDLSQFFFIPMTVAADIIAGGGLIEVTLPVSAALG